MHGSLECDCVGPTSDHPASERPVCFPHRVSFLSWNHCNEHTCSPSAGNKDEATEGAWSLSPPHSETVLFLPFSSSIRTLQTFGAHHRSSAKTFHSPRFSSFSGFLRKERLFPECFQNDSPPASASRSLSVCVSASLPPLGSSPVPVQVTRVWRSSCLSFVLPAPSPCGLSYRRVWSPSARSPLPLGARARRLASTPPAPSGGVSAGRSASHGRGLRVP